MAKVPRKHVKQVRYYYCMAMAAIISLSAAEVHDLSCCSHTSVTKENLGYLKLLERTGLPSIEEIAMQDASTAIRQVFELRPQWFVKGTKRQQKKASSKNEPIITGVSPDCKKTLIAEIFQL